MIAQRDHVFVGFTVSISTAEVWRLEARFIVAGRALERLDIVTGDECDHAPVLFHGGAPAKAYMFATPRIVERGADFSLQVIFKDRVIVQDDTCLSFGLLDVDLISPVGLAALMRRASNNSAT